MKLVSHRKPAFFQEAYANYQRYSRLTLSFALWALIYCAVSAAPVQDRAPAPETLPLPPAPEHPIEGPAACAPDLPSASELTDEGRIKTAGKIPLRQNAPEYRLAKATSADSAQNRQADKPRIKTGPALLLTGLGLVGLNAALILLTSGAFVAGLAVLTLLLAVVAAAAFPWLEELFGNPKEKQLKGRAARAHYRWLAVKLLLVALACAAGAFLAYFGAAYFFAMFIFEIFIGGGVELYIGLYALAAIFFGGVFLTASLGATGSFLGALGSFIRSFFIGASGKARKQTPK